MKSQLPLFPDSASSLSPQVDALFLSWSLISLFFTVLIAVLILLFMVRYRRRGKDDVGKEGLKQALWLEIGWTAIPLGIALAMFVWGTRVFLNIYRPPADAVEYTMVGKQWMWKFQHPDGHREINTLHIPVGRPIRLKLTSEDVIHSFYAPAFRIKQDALPGRYTEIWFRATRTGTYHLFCAEYCGTEHSKMGGWIYVMEPRQYEDWLAGGPAGKSVVASGAELFKQLACPTCHVAAPNRPARGPLLDGLLGSQVHLAGGETVTADDNYVRESILNPTAKVVQGYDPIMPTYQGQVSEEQILQLISYVKSLTGAGGAAGTGVAGGTAPQDTKP